MFVGGPVGFNAVARVWRCTASSARCRRHDLQDDDGVSPVAAEESVLPCTRNDSPDMSPEASPCSNFTDPDRARARPAAQNPTTSNPHHSRPAHTTRKQITHGPEPGHHRCPSQRYASGQGFTRRDPHRIARRHLSQSWWVSATLPAAGTSAACSACRRPATVVYCSNNSAWPATIAMTQTTPPAPLPTGVTPEHLSWVATPSHRRTGSPCDAERRWRPADLRLRRSGCACAIPP
jgi:hypothetical protein